jgi:hypothetical protein
MFAWTRILFLLQPNLCWPTKTKTEALQIVSHYWNLCRTTEVRIVRPNFVSYNQMLCCTTKVCIIRPKFASYDQIFCRPTEFCIVWPNFESYDQILRRMTKFCVVRPNFVFCVIRPLKIFDAAESRALTRAFGRAREPPGGKSGLVQALPLLVEEHLEDRAQLLAKLLLNSVSLTLCRSIVKRSFCIPYINKSQPGWPDWSNFRLLSDCFLWEFFTITKVVQKV